MLLGFEDLSDDLFFFNQEGSDDAISDARSTSRTTISAGHCLTTLGESTKGSWPGKGETPELEFTIAAFGYGTSLFGVQINQSSSWCLGDPPLVRVGVVGQSSAKGKSLNHDGR